MSNNNQNQAMQRFFEFVFNVPGDCFCCTWSISCFLETVEHMEGDKRWRSICTIGMSLLSLIIVFLLTLALCPKFYWSEINQIVMFNSTQNYPHINYSSSTYIPTMYLNSTELNASLLTKATNALLKSPINDIQSDLDDYNDNDNDNDNDNNYNVTKHSVTFQHIGLHLNLWHINYCIKNYSNDTYYKNYLNNTKFINNTDIITNESCSFITYRESGTTSSTQDLSLWFIIFVIALLLLGCGCVLGTHPIFDVCHRKNTTLRSSIQKILAIAITILCACILNWSSFVFAAVFENQVEKYQDWQEKVPITQSNLGTGMLAVNGAMLLGIILSVIHCGAPIRTDLNSNNGANANNHQNDQQQQQQQQGDDQDDEKIDSNNNNNNNNNDNNIHLTNQQRMLLRHIPGGNSSMGNMAILTNPESWFKSNNNNNNDINTNNMSINIVDNKNNDKNGGNHENEGDEFKEFEYQNMNIINDKDDKIYNANLSMKRIRKKDKKKRDEKQVSLLLDDDSDDNDKMDKMDKIHCSDNNIHSDRSDNDIQ